MFPSCRNLSEKGILSVLKREFVDLLEDCRLCPRECGVNRLEEELGFCRSGRKAVVASHGPHYGEEHFLVGRGGSGTIFMANCNLSCVFCQNFDISHGGKGKQVEAGQLSKIMLNLQDLGVHNINFVTPSHEIAQILEALELAVKGGLNLPLVYNSGGYDSVDTLKRIEGVFDIYMPDLKYSDERHSRELSAAPDYPEVSRSAVREMHRQVGDLVIEQGIAKKGLIVRHLVLPGGLAGSRDICRFLAREISKDTCLNLMDQYRPAYRAHEHPVLNRRLTSNEYRDAIQIAREEGLWNLAGFT